MSRLVLVAVSLLLLAACEALPRQNPDAVAGSAEYRTGSNIPQKERDQKRESYTLDPSQAPRPATNPAARMGG